MRMPKMLVRDAPSRRARAMQGEALTAEPPPRGRVKWLQIAALGVMALAALVFIAGVVAELARLRAVCPTPACLSAPLSPPIRQAFDALGLSYGVFAGYLIALNVVFAAVYAAIAVVIFRRRSDDRMTLLASLALFMFGTVTFTNVSASLEAAHPLWRLPAGLVSFAGSLAFIFFLYLFSNGRFVPGWTRWAALLWIAQQFPHYLFPGSALDLNAWPPLLGVLLWIGFLGTVIYAQAFRYRRISTSVQRQQTKWVVSGVVAALVGLLLGVVIQFVFAVPLATPRAIMVSLVANTLIYVAMLLIPITIGIAMLRYHLFDINLLISRALVYGMLTACVILLYILIVGGLGTAFQARGNVLISLVATGVVALVFQPLRERLQRAVNRLVYGQRDEPYAVISHLGQRLEATLDPGAVLPAIVETVARALKLPYVAIQVKRGDSLALAAECGSQREVAVRLPMVYAQEVVGELLLTSRDPAEPLSTGDLRLLRDLAREAGVAVHATQLTSELQRINQELQQSRARLIGAREEERRRLRRDLHDGLGSALTSMTFKLGAAQNLLARDPDAVAALLAELKTETQATIADIRRLIYDLRPPTLDELGLVSAIREYAAQYRLDGVQVVVDVSELLPPLPAAVELAAYRIALEALANVARHAQARSCCIHLEVDSGALQIEIADDGQGMPQGYHAGVGITAMRERAAELGGSCLIEVRPAGGTRVQARLPLIGE